MFLDHVATNSVPRNETNDDHLVVVETPGPWRASIARFTGPFFERNESTAATPSFRPCQPSDPHAVARIRVHVEFDRLRARSGVPLVLSIKYRASRAEASTFAQLVAALAGCEPCDVASRNLDLTTFTRRRVAVMLKPDRDGFARIASLAAIQLGPAPSVT